MFDFFKKRGPKIHKIFMGREDILYLRGALNNALDEHIGMPGDLLEIKTMDNIFIILITENNIN